MKPFKLIATLGLIFLMTIGHKTVNAQGMGYNTAIGLRFGGTEGLTAKFGLGNDAAIEGILGFGPHYLSITGLYEIYRPTGVNQLNWYYGGGAHVAWITNRNYYYAPNRKYGVYDQSTAIGIDGIIGIEYKIPNAPIAFSLDAKPTFSVYDSGGSVVFLDLGLGLKAAF